MQETNRDNADRRLAADSLKKYWPGLVACLLISVVITVLVIFSLRTSFVQENKEPEKKPVTWCSIGHETYESETKSVLGLYNQFAVAVDSPECSSVGNLNGSAVDAAIAAGLCNGILNAQSAGIGGGHFMLIYLKEAKKMYAIDARETAPQNTHVWSFVDKSSLKGGLAVAIPGEIYGFWQAYQLGGKLPWQSLFQPAIRLCRTGFRVSRVLAFAIDFLEDSIRSDSELTNVFVNPLTNSTYKENDLIKMSKLADTLELISNTNINEFYKGNLSRIIMNEINENGGSVTSEDFQNYKALVKKPIIVNIDAEHRLYTLPPPSSGVLVAFIMRVMRGYHLPKKGFKSTYEESLFYHRLIETFKHAFAIRSMLGDEEHENIESVLTNLNDENFVNRIRSKIVDNKTFPSDYYQSIYFNEENHGTTHLSVLASNGDAVSLSSTINLYFGARFMGKHTGIIYNNQMNDFSTPGLVNIFGMNPSKYNFIKGGKRPMSSMTPIIILNKEDEAKLILGASGGSRILTGVSQVAIKTLYMNKNIKEAIDEKRIHHQLYPKNVAEVEQGFSEDVQAKLLDFGHEMKCFSFGGSVVQGIRKINNLTIEATSDSRKGGLADGV